MRVEGRGLVRETTEVGVRAEGGRTQKPAQAGRGMQMDMPNMVGARSRGARGMRAACESGVALDTDED